MAALNEQADAAPSDWDQAVIEAEVAAIFRKHGVVERRLQQKILRRARFQLEDRATRDVARVLAQAALARGWRPPERPAEQYFDAMPLPAPDAVENKVLRWARCRGDFSVRDVEATNAMTPSEAMLTGVTGTRTAIGIRPEHEVPWQSLTCDGRLIA